MNIKFGYLTTFLAASAASVSLIAAPTITATARPLPKVCVATGPGATCQTPGNVEVKIAVPVVGFHR
jgi:hypothetical protein